MVEPEPELEPVLRTGSGPKVLDLAGSGSATLVTFKEANFGHISQKNKL